MILIIQACCILALTSTARGASDELIFDGVKHTREPIWPTDTNFLSYDRNTSDLYLDIKLPKSDKTWYTPLAVINIESRKIDLLVGMHVSREDNFTTVYAIDHHTKQIYFAKQDGIYTYNRSNEQHSFVGAKDTSIAGMFFKKSLYYKPTNGDTNWYVQNKDSFTLFDELKDLRCTSFDMTDDGHIYCVTSEGVFMKKKGSNNKELVKNLPEDFARTVKLTSDSKGRMYVIGSKGIYAINEGNLTAELLFPVDVGKALTVDDDNIFYALDNDGVFWVHSGAMKSVLSSILSFLYIIFVFKH